MESTVANRHSLGKVGERGLPDPTMEPTVSVRRAAAILGVGRSLLYSAVRRGEVASIQIGHRVVIPTTALRSLVLQGGESGRSVTANDARGVRAGSDAPRGRGIGA